MEYYYDYSPIVDRKPLRWPGGAQIAVILTVNVECWDPVPEEGKMTYPGGPNVLPIPLPAGVPDLVNHTWREYGHRVGFWRILEAFDQQTKRSPFLPMKQLKFPKQANLLCFLKMVSQLCRLIPKEWV